MTNLKIWYSQGIEIFVLNNVSFPFLTFVDFYL